jgi:hypothetical protein
MFATRLKWVSAAVLLSATTLGSVAVFAQQKSEPRNTPALNVPATEPGPEKARAGVAQKAEDPQEPAVAQKDAVKTRQDSVEAPIIQGIVLDGFLEDWPAAMPRYKIGKILDASNPLTAGQRTPKGLNLSTSPDLSAAFSVGYDPNEQLLYLAVIVRDDKLVVGHTSHLDTDAVEVFLDGLHSERRIPYPGNEVLNNQLDLAEYPVQQYIAIPGIGTIYGFTNRNTNPILRYGDVDQTKTRMAFRRKGDVTTYEWAIQVFDRYPDKPTKLLPGKRIGFDISVADKDRPASTPEGVNDPEEDRAVWIYWGPLWKGMKLTDSGSLGEIVLAN